MTASTRDKQTLMSITLATLLSFSGLFALNASAADTDQGPGKIGSDYFVDELTDLPDDLPDDLRVIREKRRRTTNS